MTEVASRIPVRDMRGERRALAATDSDRVMLRREAARERSERHSGYAVYWLYLTSPFSAGIMALVGLLIAAGKVREASEVAASHFRFQMWTFGSSFAAALTGGVWVALGSIASVGGSAGGGALALAGAGLAALSGIGFMAASVLGLARLASREPMGRLPPS